MDGMKMTEWFVRFAKSALKRAATLGYIAIYATIVCVLDVNNVDDLNVNDNYCSVCSN